MYRLGLSIQHAPYTTVAQPIQQYLQQLNGKMRGLLYHLCLKVDYINVGSSIDV